LEFNVPFQHKYGYIRDEVYRKIFYTDALWNTRIVTNINDKLAD